MLKDALILFRKESGNVFKDPAALFANYLLPLLLFPLIFGALGAIDLAKNTSNRGTVYRLAWEGSRDPGLEAALKAKMNWVEDLAPGDPAGLTLTLPPGRTPGTPAVLQVAYDSTRQDFGWAYRAIADTVSAYNDALAPTPPRPLTLKTLDLARPEAASAGLLSFLLPYLVVLFLFAGSMNLGLAVTVMEKEKGSLAVLLVNQVSRTSIALGKVLFVMASGLVNTLTSGVGMVLGLLLQGVLAGSGGVPMGVGALGDPVVLLVVLASVFAASILSSAAVVWIGVVSRTMKQAGGYVTPVYMVVLVGAIAGSSLDAATSFWLHLVPLLNTVLVMKAGILGSLQPLPVVIALGVNLVLGGLLVWMTARAFESEDVLSTT